MKNKSCKVFKLLTAFLLIMAYGCGKNAREETPKEELERMVHEEADPPSEKKG